MEQRYASFASSTCYPADLALLCRSVVQQHSNSKLMSWNDDFWKGRVGMPEPVRRASI